MYECQPSIMCRNCVEIRLALLEAKLGIVKALRLVEIQQCEKTEVSDDHLVLHEINFNFIFRFHCNWVNSPC